MRPPRIFAAVSLLIAAAFVAIALLIYPLWSDIHAFLGTTLPAMPAFAILGAAFLGYAYRLLTSAGLEGKRPWAHVIVMALIDIVMVAALAVLFDQLGTDRVVIARSAVAYLPVAAWFGALALALWFAPLWKPLQNGYVRAAVMAGLALAAILWATLPWQVAMVAQPVVFMQPGGATVAWATNMPSASWLEYGSKPELGQRAVSQAHGLLELNDRVQRVFVPLPPDARDLYLRATSEGIGGFNLTNVVKAGRVESEAVHVAFPVQGDELSLAVFSDLHERRDTYDRLAAHIPWADVDHALYIGDLLSYTVDPQQVAQSILGLSTGGRALPRVYVRGNHETRGEGARLLDEWLLPSGGRWYHTFSSGGVFFVVLDSGEDKLDADPSYAGLNDFADYHREQARWLSTVFASAEYRNAAYRVVLVHIPPTAYPDPGKAGYVAPAFAPVLDLLKQQKDIDVMMSGHVHKGAIWSPEESGLPYPITTCGGPAENNAAAVMARFGADGIHLSVLDIHGTIVKEAFYAPK